MTTKKPKNSYQETIEPIPFPDEIAHLKMINTRLDTALAQADARVDRLDKDYMTAKRYMVDYRGEIDPHEMFQNELALNQTDRTGAFAMGVRDKIAKLKDSPYFARIDFHSKDDENPTAHYVGRFSFTHDQKLLVLDWRAPAASMFYDCEVGPAGYDAPLGHIEGRLTRKRQFKIKDGALEYTLESAVNIGDDILQRELSHTSDEKMKSIIATIQKEQNQIIRSEKGGTLIIQGVAGSGKTSIALHRIAFLLYRFKDQLSAQNITILSPNKVFGDYISTVLPELGEEPIGELSFKTIAEEQLEGIVGFEPDKDPLETDDANWAERVHFKSTLDFVKQMDRYLSEIPTILFEPEAYDFGRFSVTADWIMARFCSCQDAPFKKRIKHIADSILADFRSNNYMGEDLPKPAAILKSLNKMLKIKSSLAFYKHFYKWLGLPAMLSLPAKQTLEWADVYPFLYLHAAFEGLSENKSIKHLIIDEMQDYTPVQYAVINRLFPCQKTILGDFGQFINPNHLHTLADLQQLYSDANLVRLTKSYRSTYEIITLARGIQPLEKIDPIERHGTAPLLIACKNQRESLPKIKEKLDAFLQSDNVSLGIILKTNLAAADLYEQLTSDYNLQLITRDSTHFKNGISITSVQLSKGLEFDEVLLPDVSGDTYKTDYDRSLLYIAVTRAMHELTLIYTGTPSKFLEKLISRVYFSVSTSYLNFPIKKALTGAF
ncbi:MAG: AAA family ATPase [Eubacterium sp.]